MCFFIYDFLFLFLQNVFIPVTLLYKDLRPKKLSCRSSLTDAGGVTLIIFFLCLLFCLNGGQAKQYFGVTRAHTHICCKLCVNGLNAVQIVFNSIDPCINFLPTWRKLSNKGVDIMSQSSSSDDHGFCLLFLSGLSSVGQR